jgi:hypothetical protein
MAFDCRPEGHHMYKYYDGDFIISLEGLVVRPMRVHREGENECGKAQLGSNGKTIGGNLTSVFLFTGERKRNILRSYSREMPYKCSPRISSSLVKHRLYVCARRFILRLIRRPGEVQLNSFRRVVDL